ncbi:MAG: glycosyltransferase family A protein [Syntrophobacteraceae bacterium]
MPLFSIVIPLFNKARWIGRAIESVIAQEFEDFELIIVDDGSTDESIAVVTQFEDSRISLLRQPNRGPSAARNKGAAHARGEWIALLDADDYWLDGHLEALAQLMRTRPECGVVTCNWWNEDLDGRRNEANRFASQSDSSVEDYFEFVVSGRGPLLNSSSVAIRKDVLDAAGGFDEGLRLAEDVELWCRLTMRTSFAAYHRPMAVYYQDFSGNSTRDRLYVGDAPFSSLRDGFSEDRLGYFDQYLASWRMKSLALGTLLAGQKSLVRRMALESLGSMVWPRSIVFIVLSFLPTAVCKGLYVAYRRLTGRAWMPSLLNVAGN